MRIEIHEERRSRILAAARSLFLSAGFDETGMLDIANAAGIAAGTLYNYFPSKNALLVDLFRAELSEPPGADEPLPATAESWVRFGLGRYGRFPRARWRAFMRALYADEAGRDAAAWATQGPYRDALLRIARSRLGTGRERDAERVSRVLFSVFFQAFLRWVHVGGEIDAIAEGVLDDFEYVLAAASR